MPSTRHALGGHRAGRDRAGGDRRRRTVRPRPRRRPRGRRAEGRGRRPRARATGRSWSGRGSGERSLDLGRRTAEAHDAEQQLGRGSAGTGRRTPRSSSESSVRWIDVSTIGTASVMNPGLLPVLWIDEPPGRARGLDPCPEAGVHAGRAVELTPRGHDVRSRPPAAGTTSSASQRARPCRARSPAPSASTSSMSPVATIPGRRRAAQVAGVAARPCRRSGRGPRPARGRGARSPPAATASRCCPSPTGRPAAVVALTSAAHARLRRRPASAALWSTFSARRMWAASTSRPSRPIAPTPSASDAR